MTDEELADFILNHPNWKWPNGCRYQLHDTDLNLYTHSGAAASCMLFEVKARLNIYDPGTAGHLMQLLRDRDDLLSKAISDAYENDEPFGPYFARELARLWGADG